VSRVERMTGADVAARRRHAESYLASAELVEDLGDDADVDAVANVVGSLCVLAGIAAVDAICGHALGERSSAPSHDAATVLLRKVQGGAELAPVFNRLLSSKTRTQYSPALLTTSQAQEMLTWARRLVEAMNRLSR